MPHKAAGLVSRKRIGDHRLFKKLRTFCM